MLSFCEITLPLEKTANVYIFHTNKPNFCYDHILKPSKYKIRYKVQENTPALAVIE